MYSQTLPWLSHAAAVEWFLCSWLVVHDVQIALGKYNYCVKLHGFKLTRLHGKVLKILPSRHWTCSNFIGWPAGGSLSFNADSRRYVEVRFCQHKLGRCVSIPCIPSDLRSLLFLIAHWFVLHSCWRRATKFAGDNNVWCSGRQDVCKILMASLRMF